MIVGGWIAIVLFLLIGWIGMGTCKVDKYIIKKANKLEVIKGKHIAVVTCLHDTIESIHIIRDLRSDKVSDLTTFYWSIGYNCYGYECYRRLIIEGEQPEN